MAFYPVEKHQAKKKKHQILGRQEEEIEDIKEEENKGEEQV